MANDSDDYTLSDENEEFSNDETVEITPVLLVKKKRGRPAKSSKALGKQKVTSADENQESITVPESASQTSDDSNPFVQSMSAVIKPLIKTSWVWDYFVRKPNEKGEIRAYCQFVLDNG